MNPSTWAGTATAAFTLLTAIIVFFGARAATKATAKAAKKLEDDLAVVDRKVEQVHEVVNSRLTAMLARTEAMVSLLEQHGLPVPPAEDGTGQRVTT